MPKNKDIVWAKFDCITSKNSGNWARCKLCQREMQGIPTRMKKHLQICTKESAKESRNSTVQIAPIASTSKDEGKLKKIAIIFNKL